MILIWTVRNEKISSCHCNVAVLKMIIYAHFPLSFLLSLLPYSFHSFFPSSSPILILILLSLGAFLGLGIQYHKRKISILLEIVDI